MFTSSTKRVIQVTSEPSSNTSSSQRTRDLLSASASSSGRQQRYNRLSPTSAIARYQTEHPQSVHQQLTLDDDDWRLATDHNDNKFDDVASNSVTQNGWLSGTSSSRHAASDGSHQTTFVTRQPSTNSDPDFASAAVSPSNHHNFLFHVQQELEGQRESWKSEVDKLARRTGAVQLMTPAESCRVTSTSVPDVADSLYQDNSELNAAESSSYVDTNDRRGPVFKTFVDVSEYLPHNVHVSVDKLTNRIIVEASTSGSDANCETFTQRVQLPRFADDTKMTARMNQRGILRIEVPLLYYFASSKRDIERDKQAKSFVYQVRDDPHDPSRQIMEILVNTGSDVSVRDLHVEVDGDKLVVFADTPSTSGSNRKVIKRYTMPAMADVEGITSRLGRDGRLTVLIPVKKK